MNKTSFGKGLQDGIPIGLGYFAVSFTFGIMAIQLGLTAWQDRKSTRLNSSHP